MPCKGRGRETYRSGQNTLHTGFHSLGKHFMRACHGGSWRGQRARDTVIPCLSLVLEGVNHRFPEETQAGQSAGEERR